MAHLERAESTKRLEELYESLKVKRINGPKLKKKGKKIPEAKIKAIKEKHRIRANALKKQLQRVNQMTSKDFVNAYSAPLLVMLLLVTKENRIYDMLTHHVCLEKNLLVRIIPNFDEKKAELLLSKLIDRQCILPNGVIYPYKMKEVIPSRIRLKNLIGKDQYWSIELIDTVFLFLSEKCSKETISMSSRLAMYSTIKMARELNMPIVIAEKLYDDVPAEAIPGSPDPI